MIRKIIKNVDKIYRGVLCGLFVLGGITLAIAPVISIGKGLRPAPYNYECSYEDMNRDGLKDIRLVDSEREIDQVYFNTGNNHYLTKGQIKKQRIKDLLDTIEEDLDTIEEEFKVDKK